MSNLYKVFFTSILFSIVFSNSYAVSSAPQNRTNKLGSDPHKTLAKVSVVASSKKNKINLNLASAQEISTFKGIGPKRSQAIVEFRTSHGVFKKLEDLSLVKGISKRFIEKNYAQLKNTFIL